jgi:type VI secretion system Hcp family effector
MTIYAKIAGISGDVTAEGYENWIPLLAVDFPGINRPVNITIGHRMGRYAHTPKFGEIVILKNVDRTSHFLFEATHTGKVIDQVEIDYVTSGDKPLGYSKIKLSNVAVTHSYETFDSELNKPIELIRLAYTKIEKTYIPRDATNSFESPLVTGYDLETAQSL